MGAQYEFERRELRAPPRRSAGPERRISAELETDATAVTASRSLLTEIEPLVDDEVIEDVRLLVSELVTNSVRHGGAAGTPIELDVTVTPAALHVEVSDCGGGFEPAPRRPGQSQAGGWGLFLVDRIADRWGAAQKDGTRVWFEVDLPRPTALAS